MCSTVEVLCKISKIYRKTPLQKSLFNKVTSLVVATLLNGRLHHRCFFSNFTKLHRTTFLQNTFQRLLLEVISVNSFFLRSLIQSKQHCCTENKNFLPQESTFPAVLLIIATLKIFAKFTRKIMRRSHYSVKFFLVFLVKNFQSIYSIKHF